MAKTPKEQRREARLLYDPPYENLNTVYDPAVHPEGVVRFFRARQAEVDDPERVDKKHRLEWVTKPVRVPTLEAYAASIRVHPGTLRAWAERHEAFDEAVKVCLSIQHAMIVELTLVGALDTRFAALAMKNLQGWQDKVENIHKGAVTLNYDLQDEEA